MSGAPYYAQAFSPMPGRCFRMVAHGGQGPAHCPEPPAWCGSWRALDALGSDPATYALVGDSVSDVQAAQAAGTASIGFANKPGKAERLQRAGADAIVTSMAELYGALMALQPST